ncbi:MAG: response regulator [Verrucomicrobiales bacterium]
MTTSFQRDQSDTPGNFGSVLLVDDEEELLTAFGQAFGDEFRIWTASSASEAYGIFEKHHSEIDLVVSDQRMPGECGVEFLTRVKSLAPGKPCFLATAYSDLDVLKSAINTGCVDQFISKPWDPGELNQQIKGVIGRSKQAAEERSNALVAASMMAIQAGTAGIVQLGIEEIYGPYLRSIEVFTGAVGSYYYGGNDAVLESDVHRMLDNLRACSQHSIDVLGRYEKASTVAVGESVRSLISKLQGDGEAKDVFFDVSICEPEPMLFLDEMVWHELLKLILRKEILSVGRGAEVSIDVVLHSRNSCVTSLELSMSCRSDSPVLSPSQQATGSFAELAQSFALQLLAGILGVEIRAVGDGEQVRTVTVKLPGDLISM